jgi:hypothetical protein
MTTDSQHWSLQCDEAVTVKAPANRPRLKADGAEQPVYWSEHDEIFCAFDTGYLLPVISTARPQSVGSRLAPAFFLFPLHSEAQRCNRSQLRLRYGGLRRDRHFADHRAL